jgi:predicted permease
VFGLAVLAHIIGILIATCVFKKNGEGAEVFRFASVFGNCGFMGIPLLAALIPENGALYATIYVTVFNIFVWTYGVIVFNGKTEKGALKKILLSPVLISIAIGIILFVFSITLPLPIASTIGYLSDLNTPLAMMVTGALIAKSKIFSAPHQKSEE